VLQELPASTPDEPTLAQKVAFLSQPDAYAHAAIAVAQRETHMSFIFLAGDRAYKLKKPVRFPYLDFSTLQRRESACRAELRLNRRLAPEVYLGLAPITATPGGLSIGGRGTIVDWLVVMRRLDETHTLEHAILEHRLAPRQVARIASTLVHFYRHVPRPFPPPPSHVLGWHQSLAYNRRVLLDPRLGLPAGSIRRIDAAQRRFLAWRGALLAQRARSRAIVDGHGDLRPEHVWLGDPVEIIDCLEFNARLRAVDPIDEIAFLDLECERLGAAWAGRLIRQRTMHHLHDGFSEALFRFYRCHRAMLRARLAIAHLLEPEPRTPEKWPILARTYLRLATADAMRVERSLKAPASRSTMLRGATAQSPRQSAERLAARRSSPARDRPRAERRVRHR
jgi:aminoglycoside phosphotransferase family enzyme